MPGEKSMIREVNAAKVDTVFKQWAVAPGDEVKKGDLLCIVRLGNMNREVSAKFDGIVKELCAQPDQPVPGGTPVLLLEEKEQEDAVMSVPAGAEMEIRAENIGGKSAVIKEWKKAPGEHIAAGEGLVVVTAGKLNKEIVCPYGGEVLRREGEEGATIKVGDLLAVVVSDGTAAVAKESPKTKILVIGGGPGGYVAAIRAAQLGADVTLIEKNKVGGTCLNVGCIPTKALMHSAEVYRTALAGASAGVETAGVSLNWETVQAHREKTSSQLVGGVEGLLAANGVTVIDGIASFKDAKTMTVTKTDGGTEEVTADKIILATGSAPFTPPIPGLRKEDGSFAEGVIDSTGALMLEELPASMVIIGGGVIGVELACAYAAFGTKVTVMEMMDRLMPVMDLELTGMAQEILEKQGVVFHLGAQVKAVEKAAGDGAGEAGLTVLAADPNGDALAVTAEKVLVAVGRRAYTEGLAPENAGLELERGHFVVNDKMETNVPGIYAIGDCAGKIMLAHAASAMGETAAENACGKRAAYKERVVPSCVYMFPEFAGVGKTEEQLKEKGTDYKTGRFPLVANGKSVIMEEPDGEVKILADARSGHILGGHILGPRATDLIGEIAMAMQMHGKLEDIIGLIHPHPTVAEAIHEAALAAEDRAIHFK